jgi:DNA topoisomerase-3
MIFDIIYASIQNLLSPKLTASWEKGLDLVVAGEVSADEYMEKLEAYVSKETNKVKNLYNQNQLNQRFHYAAGFYKKK